MAETNNVIEGTVYTSTINKEDGVVPNSESPSIYQPTPESIVELNNARRAVELELKCREL